MWESHAKDNINSPHIHGWLRNYAHAQSRSVTGPQKVNIKVDIWTLSVLKNPHTNLAMKGSEPYWPEIFDKINSK